jgi:diacylglycerol O-acyltransferase/trehalose O-mycolyltransferase
MAGAVPLIWLLLAGCSSTSGGPSTTGSSSPALPTTSVPAPARAARIVEATHVSGRTWDLTVDSPAVGAQVKVRLLLPTLFDAQPGRRWPVLYLLHGCCDTYVSWSRSTDIEKRTRDVDALVVMPDGGKVGFYSN